MAEEPGNIVLIQLREIRGELGAIREKLVNHDGRFDRIDESLADMSTQVLYSLGLATAQV